MFYRDLIDVLPQKLRSVFDIAYAAAASSRGTCGKKKRSYRLAAVLFDGHHFASSSTNSYKTHPILAKYTQYPFSHAESSVMIRHGLNRCIGLKLFVIRVRRDGSLGMARPCVVCQSFMADFGIKKCYYTSENGWHVL